DQCTATSSCSTPNTPTTGTCVAGGPLSCDDNNPCTADSCANNVCSNTPLPDGAACDDNNKCTGTGLGGTGDTCTAGVCAGPAVTCSHNNVWNGVETCDPASGCVAGTPPNCNDSDVCTTDTCDMVLGCQHGSDPASYALCRLNLLADAIQGTPAQELGG